MCAARIWPASAARSLAERGFLGAPLRRELGAPGGVYGALAPQLVELAARAAHGLFGFLDLARELVAPAGVALHLRAHLVDLRAHGLELGLGLGRIRPPRPPAAPNQSQAQTDSSERPGTAARQANRHGHILGHRAENTAKTRACRYNALPFSPARRTSSTHGTTDRIRDRTIPCSRRPWCWRWSSWSPSNRACAPPRSPPSPRRTSSVS